MATIENTLFIGKVHLHFSELDSTNKYASELLSKSNPTEGTVISTEFQSSGRGQIGSKWESAPQMNLTVSFIFFPHFLIPKRQFLLNQAVSLGLHDFVSHFIPQRAKIKWSNDLYVEDKKIAGMLIQNTLSSTKILSSIVGIGININQKTFGADIPNPTSLTLETAKSYNDLHQLLSILCQMLEKRYLQLKSGKYDQLHQDYLDNLYRYEQEAWFQKPDGFSFKGKITGLDAMGKLLIQQANRTEAFGIKEVKFIL